MSAAVKERIFERYYQGDTSRAGEGHGLGLSIVKRIVRLCGGEITVDSKEGEGSTFTVTLPKRED
jgi:signal transduction histidine kinase